MLFMVERQLGEGKNTGIGLETLFQREIAEPL